VAELRDVRSSLRAAAAPLLLGPAAVGYLTHAKPAAVVGALIQHSKASAGAAVSGAAASGEAVAQLVSHHGKVGAALAGATLTVAGALGLVATDQSRPEAASPRVVLTVVASAQRSSAGASLGPADRAPAGAEATRSLPPGQATGRSGAFGGSRPAGSGATGQATGTGGPTANDQPGATTSAGSQPGQPSGSGATQPATTTVAPATVAPATSAPGSDPSAGATSSLEPGSTAANPIDSVTPTPSPTATQPTPGPQKER
jgi:hypothetical protein